MNESAEQENPSTFLSVTMGPVKGTDDTKRLIAIFFYNTGKDRDEIKVGYGWRLIKEISAEESL